MAIDFEQQIKSGDAPYLEGVDDHVLSQISVLGSRRGLSLSPREKELMIKMFDVAYAQGEQEIRKVIEQLNQTMQRVVPDSGDK